VAGLFYPGDPAALERKVDDLLAATTAPPAGSVRAVVSPHAGYPYSGQLAAHSIRALADSSPRVVILIGPSHVEYFPFTSVYRGESYETPLGTVSVDLDLAGELSTGRDTIAAGHEGHDPRSHAGARGEHSLEVQLPLLQRALPGVRIVPVIMGEQRWENCHELGEAIADVLADDVAILASSDLSHFHDYDRARTLDTAFADRLQSMDARALHDAVRQGQCEACGAGPVVAALEATRRLTRRRAHILARNNSGDVTGDRTSVVGYLAAAITAAADG
jgi:AmmeMemoRadiSam system protein B